MPDISSTLTPRNLLYHPLLQYSIRKKETWEEGAESISIIYMPKRKSAKISRSAKTGRFVSVKSHSRGKTKAHTIVRVSESGKKVKETLLVTPRSAKAMDKAVSKRGRVLRRLAKK